MKEKKHVLKTHCTQHAQPLKKVSFLVVVLHCSRARAAAITIKGDNADQDAGIKLVLKAIEAPLREIVANAGGEASVVINAVVNGSGNYGFNAANDTTAT